MIQDLVLWELTLLHENGVCSVLRRVGVPPYCHSTSVHVACIGFHYDLLNDLRALVQSGK